MTQMFEAMHARKLEGPLRDRREPGAIRGRPASRAGMPRRTRASSSCRTSSSPARRRWRTWCSPRRPAGASPKARSRTASAACSACAKRSSRPAMRATTCGSSRRSPSGSATIGASRPARACGTKSASVAPAMFGGMSYARLEAEQRPAVAVPDESDPGAQFLHARLWAEPMTAAARAVRRAGQSKPPVEMPDAEYPFQLTTGRRLESYNTGVQTGGYDFAAPSRRDRSISRPEDAKRARRRRTAMPCAITSRRGSVVAPARIDRRCGRAWSS